MSIQAVSLAESRLTHAALDRARRFDRTLLELSMSGALTSGNLDDALHEICAAAARALDVERTNVWFFDASGTRLRQAVAVEAARDGADTPPELSIEDNPPYFAALQQQRIIAADDVHRDPRTERFAARHLQPRGITSMLDAAIRLHGRLLGVICSEHVGPARVWDAEEERFAASLGDLVALAVVADDRAAAQCAMRDSEARYRLLVDGARDLIFNLDHVGTVTSLNPALREILGLEPADWTGRHFAGLVYPDDVAFASELFQRAVSGEALPNFDLRLRDVNAQGVWFEFTISIERDGGHVSSVFGVGRDITERKQAETRRRALVEVGQALARFADDVDAALAAVHEQVASALGCAHVATVLCDPGTAAVTRIARGGSAVGDAAPAASDDAFPPPDLVKRTIERAETSVLHAEVIDSHGVATPRATAACALRSPEGVIGALVARRDGPGGFDGEQIDLLDRVARELVLAIAAARRRSELQENAAVSAALARVGQVLITSVDMPRLLERLCRVTAEVLGSDASYTFLRDESVGAFVRAASYGDPPQVAEALRAVPVLDEHTPGLAAALERDWVVLARADDGSIARPLWDAYGTRSGVFIALLHGSTLVGAQVAALRGDDVAFGPGHVRIAQGIAQLASLAIANARLVGELEAASRIKSDFVATMSHELRTPLNVILGYNDLLLHEEFGTLNAPQRDTLRRVRASAAELQELIEATLDLSRLESGTVALRLEEVHLESWINEVRDETAALRELKPHLDVRWNATLPPTRVLCDPLKLKVILKNLVGNAVKFTHQGFVEVSVAAANERIAMTVNDSGIGMTPEVRAVIFEAFRQGDASMTRPYGGVGLGLYIVARLVEALRGRITVESEPGRGSTFRIEIPLDARGVHTIGSSRPDR